MTTEASAVFDTLRKALGRVPEEHELSLYLHRALIEGVPLPVIEREILRAADERFVRQTWQTHAGRQPTPEELDRDLVTCETGRFGREAVLGRLSPESGPADPFQLDGDAFIRAAWRSMRNCEPDARQLAETLRRLVAGELSKRGLLRELGAPATAKEKLLEAPVIGPLLRILELIRNLPTLERKVASLGHRVADLEQSDRRL